MLHIFVVLVKRLLEVKKHFFRFHLEEGVKRLLVLMGLVVKAMQKLVLKFQRIIV